MSPSPLCRIHRRSWALSLALLTLVRGRRASARLRRRGSSARDDTRFQRPSQALQCRLCLRRPDRRWRLTYTHELSGGRCSNGLPMCTPRTSKNVWKAPTGESTCCGAARKRFDLIIATLFGYMDAMEAVAAEFPETKSFCTSPAGSRMAKPVATPSGAMEDDMKYLWLAHRRRTSKGADAHPRSATSRRSRFPEVVRMINATQRGVRRSCPECTMDIRWLNAWVDPSREQGGRVVVCRWR